MKKKLDDNFLEKFLKRLEQTSFSDEKLELLSTQLKTALFYSSQAKRIVKIFPFNQEKSKACILLYSNLVDPENLEEMLEAIDSSFTISDTRNIINSMPIPNNNEYNFDDFYNYNEPEDNIKILDENLFQKYYEKIKNENFATTQFPILENMAKFFFLNTNQAEKFVKIFTFAKEKIKAITILYPKLTDPENNEDIIDSLSFESDKNEVREIIKDLPNYY